MGCSRSPKPEETGAITGATVKVYNGEIVPDKVVGEDLMTELKEELDAKVGKAPESAAEAAAKAEAADSEASDEKKQ